MTIWLIALIILSGALFLPAYEVSYVKYVKYVPIEDRELYPWIPLMVLVNAYVFIGIVLWGIPTVMALTAPGILGADYDNMERDYPQIAWIFKPVLPLVGPLMLIAALIIRCFYTPPKESQDMCVDAESVNC